MHNKKLLRTSHRYLSILLSIFFILTVLISCGGGGTGNNAPIGDSQSVTTDEDVALTIVLSARDADGDSLTYDLTDPSHGIVTGSAPNLTYTPNPNYSGSDAFSFTVNDGQIDSAVATVSISITAVNDAPIALDAGFSVQPGKSVTDILPARDVDGDSLVYIKVTDPTNGILNITNPATGAFTHKLDSTASGDTFTFLANDGQLDSNIATVIITGTSTAAPASGLQTTAGDQRITINWDAVQGADSYNIYWFNTSGTGTNGTKISGVTSPFYHDGLTNGTNYYYVITAVNAVGESATSTELTDTPLDISISSLNFIDTNLAACITAATSGLTYVHELTFLSCTNKGIVELGGIEALTGLTRLQLGSNNISNISSLVSLTNLDNLWIQFNSISDIRPLSGLTSLIALSLNHNLINDVTTLSSLTNLIHLDLYNNNISDISALSNLTNLVFLELGINNISNINALSNMTKMDDLGLINNNVNDISAMSGLINMTTLSLDANNISDVSALSGLTRLSNVTLMGNNISDISAFSSLTDMIYLSLDGNNISDVSPLSFLTNLKTVSLYSNSIGGPGVGNVDTLTSLTSATSIRLGGFSNISMSCSELTTLINALGSPPVDMDNNASTTDFANNGFNCTNP